VVGISLLSPCTFRLRRKTGGGRWVRASLVAEPGSAYLLAGPSRTEWEHSIPAVGSLRYSTAISRTKESEDPMPRAYCSSSRHRTGHYGRKGRCRLQNGTGI
jgi:hypothetical protein